MKPEKIINDIYAVAEKNNCNIIIPVDCIVSNNLNGIIDNIN